MVRENTPKYILRILDNLVSSELKIFGFPRKFGSLGNFFFNEYGQLETREGFDFLRNFYVSSPVTSVHCFPHDQGLHILAVAGGKLYEIAPNGEITEKLSSIEDNVCFVNFFDTCYFAGGTNIYKYRPGRDVYKVGFVPPENAPTGTIVSGGSLSAGKYSLAYTFVDLDDYESAPSPLANFTLDSAGRSIVLNIATSDDPKVAQRRIYRTTANGSILFLDTVVNDNTTTSVTISRPDSEIVYKDVLKFDRVFLGGVDLLTVRGNRLFASVGNLVYFSDLGKPEHFSPFALRTSNGQNVTGFASTEGGIFVFTVDRIELLAGYDEKEFALSQAFGADGCIAPKSIATLRETILFLGTEGVYIIAPPVIKLVDERISRFIKENLDYSKAHLAYGFILDNKYFLGIPTKGSDGVITTMLYMDLNRQTVGTCSFCVREDLSGGSAFRCATRVDYGGEKPFVVAGSLLSPSGSGMEGRVYFFARGANEDVYSSSYPFPIRAWDRIFTDFGIPDAYKQIYEVYVGLKFLGSVEARVVWRLDGVLGGELRRNMVGYGHDEWYRFVLPGGGQRCRELELEFSVSCRTQVVVKGYMIVYRPEVPEWL